MMSDTTPVLNGLSAASIKTWWFFQMDDEWYNASFKRIVTNIILQIFFHDQMRVGYGALEFYRYPHGPHGKIHPPKV